MPTINVLGVPHTYELILSKSSRPVLIFIHGWLLSRHYWQPLIELLSSDYSCLVYDLRGFGDSQSFEKPEGVQYQANRRTEPKKTKEDDYSNYTLAAYANDLKVLLQQLEIEQAWLIGHSLGGSIALWVADLCREQVKGVICLNSGGGIYLKEEFERFRAFGSELVKRRPFWLTSIPLVDCLFARIMVYSPLERHWGKQRVIDFVKADEKAALGALLESTTESEVHFLPQLVSRLKQPVYFLAGSQDKVMELKYVHHLASFHPLFQFYGYNVLEIPDCGHLSMVEQPAMVSEKIATILMSHHEIAKRKFQRMIDSDQV